MSKPQSFPTWETAGRLLTCRLCVCVLFFFLNYKASLFICICLPWGLKIAKKKDYFEGIQFSSFLCLSWSRAKTENVGRMSTNTMTGSLADWAFKHYQIWHDAKTLNKSHIFKHPHQYVHFDLEHIKRFQNMSIGSSQLIFSSLLFRNEREQVSE